MNDLGKAFSFPFRDERWFGKFLIGALFMLLSILLVGVFILAGYFVRVTQAAMRKEAEALPAWDDIGGMLVSGFKFVVVYLIYSIPIFLLYIPLVVMAVAAGVGGQGEEAGLFTGLYGAAVVFLIVPYALALSLLMPVITYRFAERENIGDALDIGGIIAAFRRNWQSALIVALIAVGIQSFAAVGLVLLFIGVFFTIFYAYLVSAYLFGALGAEDTGMGVRKV